MRHRHASAEHDIFTICSYHDILKAGYPDDYRQKAVMVYNTFMAKEEKQVEPFTTSASVTARYLAANTGLSHRLLSRYLGMTPRMFSNLLSGRADGVPVPEWNEAAVAVNEAYKMQNPAEELAPGMYYADLRPKRRDGRPIAGRLK